ncbi:MAG: sulfatase family protein [Promethearchaeota archaeon]
MAPEKRRKPNFLLIMADQLRWDCIEPNNPKIRTPNIKALAERGVVFERAYSPTPVCAPCRGSILTGQYPSTHRLTHNETFLPQDYTPTLGQLFRAEGYYTHFIGKSHLSSCHDEASPESPPHVHDLDYFEKFRGPWYGFEHADLSIGHTTENHAWGMHYGVWLRERGVDISKYFGNTAYTAYGAWDLPEEYHSSRWVAEVTSGAIEAATGQGRPFFIWANFQDPHNPCVVPEPWASMYDPADIPTYGMTDEEAAHLDQKPPFYREVLAKKGAYAAHPSDPGLPGPGNVASLDWTREQVQENAACYYGMVSLLDKYVGAIVESLEEAGQLEDTVVVFTSDHGDLLGNHGFFYKSLVSYDDSMRVPLVVSYPRRVPKGLRSGALHSLVDIPATFLSLAGARVPREFEGVDQSPVWVNAGGAGVRVRSEVVVEERPYDTDFNERVLVNDRFKLCFYANREYGELYDLVEDPDQVHNLWDDPGHASTKLDMVCRLLSHEVNKGRPRQTPSGAWHDKFPAGLANFDKGFQVFGKLKLHGDAGDVAMEVSMPFGGSRIEVKVREVLEEFLGERVTLVVGGEEYSGVLSEGGGKVGLARADGGHTPLIEVFESYDGVDFHAIALLDPGTGDAQVEGSPVQAYRLVFSELFPVPGRPE